MRPTVKDNSWARWQRKTLSNIGVETIRSALLHKCYLRYVWYRRCYDDRKTSEIACGLIRNLSDHVIRIHHWPVAPLRTVRFHFASTVVSRSDASILRWPIRYDSIYRYRNDISIFSTCRTITSFQPVVCVCCLRRVEWSFFYTQWMIERDAARLYGR